MTARASTAEASSVADEHAGDRDERDARRGRAAGRAERGGLDHAERDPGDDEAGEKRGSEDALSARAVAAERLAEDPGDARNAPMKEEEDRGGQADQRAADE